MFCKNCGNQIPDGAVFCNKCGATVNGTPAQGINQQSPGNNSPVYPRFEGKGLPEPTSGNNGGNKKIIVIILIVLLLLLIGIAATMKIMGIGPFEPAVEETVETDTKEDEEDDSKEEGSDKNDTDSDDTDEAKEEVKAEEEDDDSIEKEDDPEEEVEDDEQSLEESDAAVRKKLGKDKKKKKKAASSAVDDEELSDIEDMIMLAQSRTFTEDDLDEFSSFELSAIRNGIYAYRGYVFQTAEWNEYFSEYDWYEPDPDFEQGDVSELENKNAAFIKEYEEDNYGGIYTF